MGRVLCAQPSEADVPARARGRVCARLCVCMSVCARKRGYEHAFGDPRDAAVGFSPASAAYLLSLASAYQASAEAARLFDPLGSTLSILSIRSYFFFHLQGQRLATPLTGANT